ncbi:MAG: Hpt domain-containing protein [Aquisalimonadaceae bacterium]
MKTQEFDRSALGWVRKELDETLSQAAQALQEYSEDPDDRTRLRFCATYLHQVYGTLQMLELYGVSMLAEEMEKLIDAMLADSVTSAQDAEEALMTAILRSSELLERIQAGQNDSPLIVLPLVNDLRAARGEKLLSEGTLFFTSPGAAQSARRPRDADANLAAVARARRPRYQRGLLALLRGAAGQSHINDLLTVLGDLDDASTDDRSGDLWWVAGGVVEGLDGDAIKPGLSVQNLLRQVDQELRRAIRDGEQALINDPPSELFSNLLYYASQAGPLTDRLQAIHERFGLEGLASEAEAQTGQTFVPGSDILESVATAIREDVTGVKDALDLFVRSGQKDAGRLEQAGASLQRVADTLGMLGLGAPRSMIREQVDLVERLAAGGEADEQQLIDLAKSLLYVESSLDALVSGGATVASPERQDEGAEAPPDDSQFFDMEYRAVYRTTVREAVADITAIKEAIVRFIEREDHAALDDIGPLARRLQGALDIIGLERAGSLIQGVASYLRQHVIEPLTVPDGGSLDALADAITSLEYYLEAVLENRSGRETILEVAERSIARLGGTYTDTSVGDRDEPADEFITMDAGSLPGDDEKESSTAVTELSGSAEAGPDTNVADAQPPASSRPPSRTGAPGGVNHGVVVMADEMDEEILEIFLEEVDEVLETLREVYPLWHGNAEDSKSLSTVRRMFHTLKGSGRMAGALLMGELGWSVERMLNRIIDGNVQPNGDVFDVIERTMGAVPELARELKDGTAPESDVRWIMRKADILADPDRLGELADLPEPGATAAGEQSVAPDSEADVVADEQIPSMEPEGGESADEDVDYDLGSVLEAYADITPGTPVERADADADEPSAKELPEADPEQADVVDKAGDEISDSATDQLLEWSADDDVPEPGDDSGLVLDESGENDADLDKFLAEFETSTDEQVEAGDLDETSEADDSLPVEDASDSVPEPALDPALYEIFSNETDDHLSVVRAFINEARKGGDQGGVTEELARALHTLTGSARMADVQPVARLGRKMEEFAGQRRDTGRPLDQEDIDLLEAGVARIDALVRALGDARADLPDIDDLLEAVTERQRARTEPATDAGDARRDDATAVSAEESPPRDASADGAPVTEPGDEGDQADVVASVDDIDSDLVELFLEEAEDILQFLESSILGWEDGSGTEARITELHRSLHTLKGGARLAHFDHVGDLCHALESLTSDVEAHRIPADDRFFDLLHTVMERLADMVAKAGEGVPTGGCQDLLDAIARMRRGEAPSVGAQEPAAASAAAAEPESEGDASAGSQAAAGVDEQGRDNELVEVFLEEATEILQAIESAQHAWADQPDDREQLIEIERALHTLKGGARMAGFPPIANLSHALETLLNLVRGGSVATDERLFELLDLTHDRLHMMREGAAGSLVLEEAVDLLAQIEAFREGKAQPAAPAPATETSTPEHEDKAPAPREQGAKGRRSSKQAPVQERADAGQARDQAEIVARGQADQVRVRADLLDNLVNFAGEVSIYRARLDQQVGAFRFNLAEFDQTVSRLRDQLRTLEIETEAQILYRYEREHEQDEKEGDFDPLELDRFSRMQELSRALSESVSDLGNIQGMLDNLARESETLLLQQSRVNTELQDGLMRTRMVPFANLAPRLRRIVRQTAQELGRKAQLSVEGAQGEMDRTVLERVTAPLEHMLRNAVAHGIETPETRLTAGKPAAGHIRVSLNREGADVVLRVQDDGAGMNLEAIRRKAMDRGLLREDAELTDREVMQFVLEQGFSTADVVTQIAGRGVGMDVVNSEIKQLGGILEIDSSPGEGTLFTVRLPFTLAMNQALLCVAGEQVYAIPLSSIEGVVRLTRDQLETYFAQGETGLYHYGDQDYQVVSLLDLLGTGEPGLAGLEKRIPVVLVQTGDHRLALQVDSLLGNREIVVKSVGPQISTVPGIFGATILADGRVVLILDVSSLARLGVVGDGRQHVYEQDGDGYRQEADAFTTALPVVMVVDDSITMRKVATRLLERNHMQVVTAKDGVDAVAKLQEHVPDAMLLDIEMPRMDGYELATHMRNDERLRNIPIIMITSRTGEKHRQRALEIGVNRYLGKPYQEHDLLANLHELLGESDVRH